MSGFKDPKLSHEQQMEVCEKLAKGASAPDVVKHFQEKYQITLRKGSIYHYRDSQKWRPYIEKMRDTYLVGIMDVPISQKRVRLERLEDLYKACINKRSFSAAKEVLRAAKDEIEGNGDINIQMNRIEMISDDEIKDRIRKIKGEMHSLSSSIDVTIEVPAA